MGKHLLVALGMATAIFMANDSAFAAGDAAKGEKVFKKCAACHTVKLGKHKVGPSLAGVVGRKAGSAVGFKRYRGLKAADWSWDEKMLDEWLLDPKKFAKKRGRKSGMVFKLKKAADRENVIAYLKTK
jgi:cytochrome c